MYVLDTNAFYYAAEISEFTYDKEKLKVLISSNDTFISSTFTVKSFCYRKWVLMGWGESLMLAISSNISKQILL